MIFVPSAVSKKKKNRQRARICCGYDRSRDAFLWTRLVALSALTLKCRARKSIETDAAILTVSLKREWCGVELIQVTPAIRQRSQQLRYRFLPQWCP